MTRTGATHSQQPGRCAYCGDVMPPTRPVHATRCSWMCTIRAAGGVDPPGVRRCPTCGAAIDPTTHANRRYCSLACRDRMARRLAGAPLEDAAARRQAVLEKARADAERTNAEMFASSYSGKWGDYHSEGVDQWEQA